MQKEVGGTGRPQYCRHSPKEIWPNSVRPGIWEVMRPLDTPLALTGQRDTSALTKRAAPLGRHARPCRQLCGAALPSLSTRPAGVCGVPGATRPTCSHSGPPLLTQFPFPGWHLLSLPLFTADVSPRPKPGPSRLPGPPRPQRRLPATLRAPTASCISRTAPGPLANAASSLS